MVSCCKCILPSLFDHSAGVGRTGTFIALDTLLEQAKVENQVGIFDYCLYMREQRVNMIQTLVSYLLTHLQLRVSPAIVVWIYDNFDINLGIENNFTKCFLENLC